MSTPAFIFEMPIKDSDDVVRFLEPKFDFGRSVYNATLSTALGRLERMRASLEWREAVAMEKDRERNRRLNGIRQSWGLPEYGLHAVANAHRNGAKRFVRRNEPGAVRTRDECILGVHVAQKIGTRVWKVLKSYMSGNGGRPLSRRKKPSPGNVAFPSLFRRRPMRRTRSPIPRIRANPAR